MSTFAAQVVMGYESHDDYIETNTVSVTVDDPAVYGFAQAEEAITDLMLTDGILPEYFGGDGWWRVETIERVAPEPEPVAAPIHTVNGKGPGPDGWPYGTTHDMDCPACVASGASFGASPRSEAYWAS